MRTFKERFVRLAGDYEGDVAILSPMDMDEGRLVVSIEDESGTESRAYLTLERENAREIAVAMTSWCDFEDTVVEHEVAGEVPRWRARELAERESGEVL